MIVGFSEGYRVGFSGEVASKIYKNHNSAHKQPKLIEEYTKKEIEAGRILDPLESPPKVFHCAPIGLVPKKDKDQFRVRHDLSYPLIMNILK